MKRTLCLAFVLCACAQPQKPYQFVAPLAAEDPVDVVSRTLAMNGFAPTGVDRQSGIVQTKWEDTGFLYGQVQGVSSTIVRRYTAVVAKLPASSEMQVQLRADVQRCQQGSYTIGDVEVRGSCEHMDGLVKKHQDELNALGAKLQQSLGSPVVPARSNQ